MRKVNEFGPSLVVLATAALVLLIGPTIVRELTYRHTQAEVLQARDLLEATTILEQINDANRAIARAVEPSVVHISASQMVNGGRPSLSTGSGWIYDNDGHIVTNHHVVADADRIDVQLSNGALRIATVLGSDPATDIAVLHIDPDRLHPAVRADIRSRTEQGDIVFAFGSPFDFRFSMSQGIISGQGRHVGVIRDQVGNAGYENFIQVDAAINPGNSGGPLTDHHGRVIGMNTAIATGGSRSGGLDSGQFAGIGLAIPLEMIEPVVDQIIEKGYVEKGFLGVQVADLPADNRIALGFDGEGALILLVEPDTPAFRSGMKRNDIVLSIDGRPIASEAQLRSTVSSLMPGDTVPIHVWRFDAENRAGQEVELTVTLGVLSMLARGVLPPNQPEDHLRELGIARMMTSTQARAAERGIPFAAGVLIDALVPESMLSLQVEPGSTIVDVNGSPISSTAELLEHLRLYNLRARDDFRGRETGGAQVRILRPSGRYGTVYLRYRASR